MDYIAPNPIILTDVETALYASIPDRPHHDNWHGAANAMERLVLSLLDRKAVPEVRLRLFIDPEFAETGGKSRQQVFESNGTSGNEIFRHPHFIPYLRHFVDGPNLPRDVIDGLCTLLNEDSGTSGMAMDQYRRFARTSIREYGLDAGDAATEFFRLGVEIGMGLDDARTLRDAARSTR